MFTIHAEVRWQRLLVIICMMIILPRRMNSAKVCKERMETTKMKRNNLKTNAGVCFVTLLTAVTLAISGCGAGKNDIPETSVVEAEQNKEDTENKTPLVSETEESVENTQTASTENIQETVQEEEKEEVKVVDRNWNNEADISWIDPEKPMVALSFDDGPVNPVSDTSSAIRIQNALADNGMHATFFYWGNSLNDRTKKELERAYELGFELGNHTKSHPDLTKLTEEKIEAEAAYIDKVLTSITGAEKFLLRPPYLAVSQKVKDTINVPLISCGIDSLDWNNATTQEIIDKITAAAEDGSLDGKIVLMHETYVTTAEAVEYLVPYLKEQGYQIVNISELFKVRGKEMKAGVVYTGCK